VSFKVAISFGVTLPTSGGNTSQLDAASFAAAVLNSTLGLLATLEGSGTSTVSLTLTEVSTLTLSTSALDLTKSADRAALQEAVAVAICVGLVSATCSATLVAESAIRRRDLEDLDADDVDGEPLARRDVQDVDADTEPSTLRTHVERQESDSTRQHLQDAAARGDSSIVTLSSGRERGRVLSNIATLSTQREYNAYQAGVVSRSTPISSLLAGNAALAALDPQLLMLAVEVTALSARMSIITQGTSSTSDVANTFSDADALADAASQLLKVPIVVSVNIADPPRPPPIAPPVECNGHISVYDGSRISGHSSSYERQNDGNCCDHSNSDAAICGHEISGDTCTIFKGTNCAMSSGGRRRLARSLTAGIPESTHLKALPPPKLPPLPPATLPRGPPAEPPLARLDYLIGIFIAGGLVVLLLCFIAGFLLRKRSRRLRIQVRPVHYQEQKKQVERTKATPPSEGDFHAAPPEEPPGKQSGISDQDAAPPEEPPGKQSGISDQDPPRPPGGFQTTRPLLSADVGEDVPLHVQEIEEGTGEIEFPLTDVHGRILPPSPLLLDSRSGSRSSSNPRTPPSKPVLGAGAGVGTHQHKCPPFDKLTQVLNSASNELVQVEGTATMQDNFEEMPSATLHTADMEEHLVSLQKNIRGRLARLHVQHMVEEEAAAARVNLMATRLQATLRGAKKRRELRLGLVAIKLQAQWRAKAGRAKFQALLVQERPSGA